MDSFDNNVSNTAAQTFDKQFPDADPSFETENGMMKAFSDFECNVCGRRTAWFHFQKAVYLCSQDCLTRYQSKQ